MNRDFTAQAPNLVWLTDITEHPTAGGKVYCCATNDVYSNRIVGYAIDERMTAHLAVTALRTAVARRRPRGTLIVHSYRGGQFRSRAFRAVLTANQLTGSMGRVASAGDNSAMESFFAPSEEWSRPSPLADPQRTPLRDHPLDRAHLQPARPPTRSRPTHPRRVRSRLHTRSRSGCMINKTTVNQTCSSPPRLLPRTTIRPLAEGFANLLPIFPGGIAGTERHRPDTRVSIVPAQSTRRGTGWYGLNPSAHPLKVAARVRIPYGLPRNTCSEPLFGVALCVSFPACQSRSDLRTFSGLENRR